MGLDNNNFEKFRNGKINGIINYTNVGLILMFLISLLLWFLTMFFTSGLSMFFGKIDFIKSPLKGRYLGNDFSEKIYLDYLDDNYLFYTINTKVFIDKELSISDENIKSIIVNEVKLEKTENNYYILTSGEYDLKFEMFQEINLDNYQGFVTVQLRFYKNDEISFSDSFVELTNNDTLNTKIFATSNSVGKYTPTYKRLGIYNFLRFMFIVVTIYSLFNIIKTIYLRKKVRIKNSH